MEPIDTTAAPTNAASSVTVHQTPEQDKTDNTDLAAISYVWVLSVVVYATRRDSPFVRFHAKQGIALFVLSLLVWFVPFVGKLLELGLLALGVMGFIAAMRGQWKDLPVIGPLSRGEWKSVIESIKGFMADIRHGMSHLHSLSAKHPKAVTAAPVPMPAQPAPVVTPSSSSVPGQASSSAVPSQP